MLLVWVRMVLSETVSSRAMSGPLRSVRSSRRTWQLALTQWFDQAPLARRACAAASRPLRGGGGRNRLARPVLRGSPKQGGHGWALVEEDSDVALRLGQRQRLFQRCQRGGDVASRVVVERLQHRDLDDAARAMSFFRCG